MATLLIDYATMRAAADAVGSERKASDFDIVALSNVVENILLYDTIAVPSFSHRQHDKLFLNSELQVLVEPVSVSLQQSIVKEATDWMTDFVDPLDALALAELRFEGRDLGRSEGYDLALYYGLSKQQTRSIGRTFPSVSTDARITVDDLEKLAEAYTTTLTEDTLREMIRGWLDNADWLDQHGQVAPFLPPRTSSQNTMRLNEIRGHVTSRVTGNFVKIYWSIFRAALYEITSRQLRIDYAPHPARSLSATISRVSGTIKRKRPNAIKHFSETLRTVYNDGASYVNDKLGVSIAPLTLAPMFPYVASKCGSRSEVIPKAYDIRDSPAIADLRGAFSEACNAARLGDVRALIKYTHQLEMIDAFLRSEAGISNAQSSAKWSILGLSVSVPSRAINTVEATLQGVRPRSLLLLRDVLQELQRSYSFGRWRDLP